MKQISDNSKFVKTKKIELIKTWQFFTIIFVALSMGMAFSHLLEMPAKMTYNGALWLKLLQTLYWGYGTIGAVIEVLAVITSIVLVFLVRHRPVVFRWTLLGAFCMVLAHVCWWIWVHPVNTTLIPLTPNTLPVNWKNLRDQWEYTHALRAVLQIIALVAIVISILIEVPPGEVKKNVS